ncbi:hypothetical protein C8J57DRAFT_1463584 [Mycena rebaudengoi]|nr:hypothetical protein C8J57DRAFT_1463584 [Mycena rebaudengoi]
MAGLGSTPARDERTQAQGCWHGGRMLAQRESSERESGPPSIRNRRRRIQKKKKAKKKREKRTGQYAGVQVRLDTDGAWTRRHYRARTARANRGSGPQTESVPSRKKKEKEKKKKKKKRREDWTLQLARPHGAPRPAGRHGATHKHGISSIRQGEGDYFWVGVIPKERENENSSRLNGVPVEWRKRERRPGWNGLYDNNRVGRMDGSMQARGESERGVRKLAPPRERGVQPADARLLMLTESADLGWRWRGRVARNVHREQCAHRRRERPSPRRSHLAGAAGAGAEDVHRATAALRGGGHRSGGRARNERVGTSVCIRLRLRRKDVQWGLRRIAQL